MTLQSGISFACNQARIGTEVHVLVDSVSGDTLVCRSEYESPEVDGEILVRNVPEIGPDPVGKFIRVRIIQADEYDLVGEFIGE